MVATDQDPIGTAPVTGQTLVLVVTVTGTMTETGRETESVKRVRGTETGVVIGMVGDTTEVGLGPGRGRHGKAGITMDGAADGEVGMPAHCMATQEHTHARIRAVCGAHRCIRARACPICTCQCAMYSNARLA